MNDTTQTPMDDRMIDAREASFALRLPYYWFADPKMRRKYRIPHYVLGGLVRYRLSELTAWAARNAALPGKTAPLGEEAE